MTYKLSGGSAQPRNQPTCSLAGWVGLLFGTLWDLLSTKSVNKRGPETPDRQNQLFRTRCYPFSSGISREFGARPSTVVASFH